MTTESVIFQALKWEIDDTGDNVIINVHGLDKDCNKVTVKIPDFKPYAYLELDPKIKWNNSKLELLYSFLRQSLHENFPVKKRIVDRKKNYYLTPGKFLWMAFNNKAGITALERIVRNKFTLLGVGFIKLTLHEQRANPILQLFAMRKIKPSGWIEANRTTKKSLREEYCDTFSTSNLEVVSSFSDVSPANVEYIINPKILSYDIECISEDPTGDTFPNPKNKNDQIICKCATVGYLQDDIKNWKTYALVNEALGKKCPDDVECTELRHFKNEKALLIGWKDFMNEIDADIITGYNTLSFDDKFIHMRANLLKCWPTFSKMGRLSGQRSKIEAFKWQSSAYGVQEFDFIDIPGRLHIDMYPTIQKEYTTLPSYTLDYVSEHFLGEHKIDLPPKEMIQKWHKGTPKDIHDIVTYCIQDTILPFKLMKKLNTFLGLSEMANVVMVPIFDLITRGQQLRVFSQVYCLAFELGIVCTEKWADYHPTDAEKEFVGATVQNPKTGYWELVSTYDFKSLYPTTIIAYNICFTTFIPPGENPPKEQYHDLPIISHVGCKHDTAIRKTKVKKVICSEHHYRFYKAEYRKGLVPMILENLLAARANTRKEISNLAKDIEAGKFSPSEAIEKKMYLDVLDKRQNGYKISSNSMYGGYGSDFSYTPFYPAAAATTAMGRKSIQDAIDFAKEYRPDTIVVYGDSVTGDTPVLLRDEYGHTFIKQISLLGKELDWENYKDFKYSFTEPINSDIEYHVAEDGAEFVMAARHMFHKDTRWSKERKKLGNVEVWTDSGWSKIKQVIRHKTVKKIYRVTTHTGSVDVTQDHSLLDQDGNQVKPVDVNVGDTLLHSFPTVLDKNDITVEGVDALKFKSVRKTILDSFTTHKKITVVNKVLAHYLWYWAKSNGYTLILNYNKESETFELGRCLETSNQCAIKDITVLGTCTDYVYDLETTSGRFQAGIGELIVKNTDSCMLKFSKVRTLKEAFEVTEDLEKAINKIFPAPMYLEFEKIYLKYFLLSKKRYIGYIGNKKGEIIAKDKKGVVLKRRDNCPYLKEIYGLLIDMVMDKKPKWLIFDKLADGVHKLLNGDVSIEKLIISKSIKDNYKSTNLPHVAVADKMRARGKYVAVGTRVQYIFVVTDNKKDPQYIKAEDPDYYIKNPKTVKIDYLYYFEKQLVNPIDELLKEKFGCDKVLKNLLTLINKGILSPKNSKQYFTPNFKVTK